MFSKIRISLALAILVSAGCSKTGAPPAIADATVQKQKTIVELINSPALQRFRENETIDWTDAVPGPDEVENEMAEKYPLKRNLKAQNQNALMMKKYYEETLIETYKKSGHRDPAWDDLTIKSMRSLILAMVRLEGARTDHFQDSYLFAKAAYEKGCRDAIIFHLLSLLPKFMGEYFPEKAYPFAQEAVKKMATASYPLSWQFGAKMRLLNIELDLAKLKPKFEYNTKLIDEQRDCLPLLWREPNLPMSTGIQYTREVIQLYTDAGKKTLDATADVEAVLSDIPKATTALACIKGIFLIEIAWKFRGSKPASETTDKQFEKFQEHLNEAELCLRKAWSQDQNLSLAAALMIRVCMGQGLPREEMELWFKRVLDSDNSSAIYEACYYKLGYLKPQWHGSEAEVRAFARQCMRTWDDVLLLPLLMIEAQNMLGGLKGYPRGIALKRLQEEDPTYWDDLKPLYAHYAKLRPDYRGPRTLLAYLAGFGLEKYDLCVRELFLLGDGYSRYEIAQQPEIKATWVRHPDSVDRYEPVADAALRNFLNQLERIAPSK